MESIELTLRQRNILYMIENASSYVTSGTLAQALKVSSRTIRNDINQMNLILKPFRAEIISTQSKGFLFQAENPERIRRLSRIDTAFFSREERIRYLAFRLAENDEPLNLYDLEDEIFVSRTALLSDIRALRHRYSYAQPYIRINLRKDEISLEKDELKIRSLLLILFHEDWDYNAEGNAFYGFHFLDEDLLSMLMKETSRILYRYGIRMDDPTLVALELTLAIMHHRCQTGHLFPDILPVPDGDTSSAKAVRDLFAAIKDKTGTIYPDAEKARIFQFISTAGLALEQWDSRTDASPRVQEEVSRFLLKIRDAFGLDFSKDREFVHTLQMFLQELLAGNSIFSQHKDLIAVKESLTAEYELAWLFQGLAPDFMNRFLTDQELCNMALCFSGAIRHHLEHHPEKKLQAVLFSHRNMAAAWAQKRKILETYGLYLTIGEILPINFKDNYDFSGTDLIISTVRKQICPDSRVESITIDDLPSADIGSCAMRIKLLSFKKIWPVPSCSLPVLFENAYWHENAECDGVLSLIELMTADYISDRIASEQHRMDITQRETCASFAIRSGIVFLHTALPAEETKLSFLTLRHPLRWNEFKISTVVMAMFRDEDRSLLFHLKVHFCNRVWDAEELRRLKTREELLPFLAISS